jgi:hypothetical protein
MKEQKTMKKAPKTYTDRCKAFAEADETALARFGLYRHIVAVFPRHRRVPLLSNIALFIIRKQGGTFHPQLRDLNEK